MSASDPSAPAPISDAHETKGPASSRSKGSSTRLLVLCGILVVGLVAAGWDYLVARPAYESTLKKVDELLPLGPDGKATGKPRSEQATQDEVHAAIGVAPTATDDVGMYLVERYSWRRGLPWATYDIWVVYDDDERKTLRDATSMKEESDVYFRTSDRPAAPSEPNGLKPLSESAASGGESSEDAETPASEAPAEPPAQPADES